MQRFGFVQATPTAAEMVSVELPLGAPEDELGTTLGQERRALSRNLFDATMDSQTFDLFPPQTPDGNKWHILSLFG